MPPPSALFSCGNTEGEPNFVEKGGGLKSDKSILEIGYISGSEQPKYWGEFD